METIADNADPVGRLVELAATIKDEHGPRVTYDSGGGEWRVTCLQIEERDVGNPLWPGGTVVWAAAAEGAEFDWHPHFSACGDACTELLDVVCGIVELTVLGQETLRLCPGDDYRVPPGLLHRIRAVTDCRIVVTSIPSAGGFPNAAAAAAAQIADGPSDGAGRRDSTGLAAVADRPGCACGAA